MNPLILPYITMNEINNDLKTYLATLKGQKIRITLKNNFFYVLNDFEFIGDTSLSFTDRKGYKILLAISEIAQIKEEVNFT